MYKISSNLKTLYGKVKISLIPNVSDFQTFIKSWSEFAALFGLKSPNRENSIKQFQELRKANKYITRQTYRLMKLAREDKMEAHDYVCKVILTKSDAFLVASIHHKTKKSPWYRKNWSKVISLVNKTRRVAKGDVLLNLKRVWIDKKLGDYARGLGVPKLEWRTYPFTLNRIIEQTLIAKKLLKTWQHGGRAFKGTHTAWEKTMFVLRDKPYIYEFDIKGFYDNIITKDVVPFLGKEMASRIQKIVDTTVPTEFQLPPEDKDKALKNYQELRKWSATALEPWKNSPNYEIYVEDYIADMMREEFGMGHIPQLEFPDSERLEYIYKQLMEESQSYPTRSVYGITQYEKETMEDRARGRERWKNLSQEGRGFPQGLSFSPILSTNALERVLRVTERNLLMYMDDGLIFGDTKETVTKIIIRLEKALTKLGIQLAPEKSGWIREQWKFVKTSKFLAIRIKEDGTLVSETRSGTSREFPNPLDSESYQEFCDTLEIAPSTSRITYNEIYLPKGKEYVIWLGNIMGNILNQLYAPDADHDKQEIKIMEGKLKSMEKTLRTRHKTLDKIEKYFPESIFRVGLGEGMEALRLTSISSIAAIRLLRYLREKKNRRVKA